MTVFIYSHSSSHHHVTTGFFMLRGHSFSHSLCNASSLSKTVDLHVPYQFISWWHLLLPLYSSRTLSNYVELQIVWVCQLFFFCSVNEI